MASLYDDVSEVLKKEFPGVTEWKSFAMWWLLAHGLDYRGREKEYIVDGPKDGGIDAIAWSLPGFDEGTVYVVQAKYYNNAPGVNKIAGFLEAVDALSGSKIEYDEWRNRVNDKLWCTYDSLRAKHLKGKAKFIFITTASLSVAVYKKLVDRNVDVYENIEMRRLLHFYKHGQTPRVPKLIFTPKSKLVTITETDKVKMMVVSFHLNDFAQAYKKHGKDLFAGNIRFGGIKGADANKVRKGIDITISEHDDQFVFSHNGITIVCQAAKKVGKKIYMFEPSVVNGAQTITHIGNKWVDKIANTRAEVLAKLIVVKPGVEFEELETDIAIRSNTQIKVDFSDLIVSDPSLVELQKKLLLKNIYLERKRGETSPFITLLKIKKERLVQVLACLNTRLGPTSTKKLQELFKNQDAVDMIREYVDNDKIFNVVALIWLDWLVADTLGSYGQKAGIKRAKTAGFAIFTAVEKALQKANVWYKLVNHISAHEDYKNFEKNESIAALAIACRNHMLIKSSGHTMNEPAFYKNKSLVDALIVKTVAKFYKKAEKIY